MAGIPKPERPVDIILKCPWWGDEICVDKKRAGKELEYPGCDKSINVSKAETRRAPPPKIPSYGDDYESVGFFVPSHRSKEELDRSEGELDAILTRHNIAYGLDGSRGYQVVVKKGQAHLARELLRKRRFKIGKLTLYPAAATSPKKLCWLTRLVQWTRQ